VAEGRADIFLAYCTAASEAKKQNPDQQIVALPEPLAVGADYGLTVISGAAGPAQDFARFVAGLEGRKLLAGYGFAPGQP
jgi:molybdate transport system substrate-binding protein